MQQPIVFTIPWPLVILGILLAIALTVLIVLFIIRALGKWRHELEEGSASFEENRIEAGKSCPRCDAINAPTARYCQACGQAI